MRAVGGRRDLGAALVVVLIAGVLRWAVMEGTLPVRPLGDENYYLGTAMQLALGHGHVSADGRLRAEWPPGQSFWLSRFVDVSSIRAGDPLPRLRRVALLDPERAEPDVVAFLRPLLLAQVGLGAALVLATFLLGRSLFDARTGLVAAALVGLDPVLVAYSHYLWSETLFAVLLTAGLIAAVATRRTGRAACAFGTGLLFGAAALTREAAVPVAACCGVWWIVGAATGERRRAFSLVLLLAVGGAVVVLPWSWRNHRVLGRWEPVATHGWAAVREGSTLRGWLRPDYPAMRAFRARYDAQPGEAERIELARREALALIEAQPARLLLQKLVGTPIRLFEPSSKLYEKLSLGHYGKVPLGTVRVLLLLGVGFYSVAMVLAVLGVAGAATRERRWLPILVVGGVLLLLVPGFVMPRYRLPLLPLLWVYAAHALRSGRALRGEIRGGRAWAAACVLAVFLGACLPYFAADAASLWARGRIASGWWLER